VFRSYHLWRVFLHLGHGNSRMALDARATPDDEFSFADAMIMTAWIDGAKNGRG